LQRAVSDYLSRGNIWRVGGMFVLADDLPYFGARRYRSQWPPHALSAGERRDLINRAEPHE